MLPKRPPKTTDEVPDLNQLAQQAEDESSLDLIVEIDNTSKELQIARPLPERRSRAFSEEPSASSAACDQDNLPTNELHTVSEDDNTATDLYNPSVSSLLSKLDQPEVAEEEDSNIVAMRRIMNQIDNELHAMEDFWSQDERDQRRTLLCAKETASDAQELIDQIPTDDDHVTKQREDLITLYLNLKRQIEKLTPEEPTPIQREKEKILEPKSSKKSKDKNKNEASVARTSPWPRKFYLVGVGLAAALLLVTRATTRLSKSTEYSRSETSVKTVNHSAGATEEQLAKGIPGVMEIQLSQNPDGSLVAQTLIIDPDGDKVKLFFKWIENEKIVEIGSSSFFPATHVARGNTYQVIVEASDGKHTSAPITTLPFTATHGQKQLSQSSGLSAQGEQSSKQTLATTKNQHRPNY